MWIECQDGTLINSDNLVKICTFLPSNPQNTKGEIRAVFDRHFSGQSSHIHVVFKGTPGNVNRCFTMLKGALNGDGKYFSVANYSSA